MALANLLGYKDPSRRAMGELNQIPEQMKGYYDPYSQAGQRELGGQEAEYNRLRSDPGGRLNEIGAGYKQSPGFQFAMQQALQGGNHAAAAGGMAGSPQHEQQNMELASNLASKDYDQWLQHAMGMYGQGLEGNQDIMHQGYNAGNEYGQTLGNLGQSRANLRFGADQQQNQFLGDIYGAAGQAAGGYFNPASTLAKSISDQMRPPAYTQYG